MNGRTGEDSSRSSGYSQTMRTISTSGGAGVLLELLKAVRQEPVTVIDGGRPAAVVLSIEEYERMRGVAWDRLMGTIERIRTRARERGLTDEALNSLLADES
jgi:prevent-host-death family protein